MAKPATCEFYKLNDAKAPDWVCTGKAEGFQFSAVGYAHKSTAGDDFMKQIAAANARIALAKRTVDSIGKKTLLFYSGDTEVAVTSDELSIKSEIIDTYISQQGAMYVLVGIKAEELK